MDIERPTGEIDEYDRLNSLVKEDDLVDRSMTIFTQTGWPPLRCRMAAIVEAVSTRWGLDDFVESQRRAVIYARWRQSLSGVSRG